ncbi:Histone-lysine N-methyltransferase, H3 lysine-79 specific [Caenorhabditis elegans]|uniref:Histone-lysine N-methyltransferase, H3 lysine-79 specific n=1 Tax=Caenorhabditis elegans TaxID=6239 RepID=Q20794_CAEEL|nr:Histone-lysine N-methyltransferase, H3 lysine-79 specific [Caenorhabditis elegans]CAA91760.2 Histone-lysine N-methyltransferase, H3 lysine-79 specific [Caenorhabditis elegans]|eukprot:NP_509981.2 Histone-lysine N-methyltransferase, H3 lysine-79 specific [Caenorhabditis elegans]
MPSLISLKSIRPFNRDFLFSNTLHIRRTLKELLEVTHKPMLDMVNMDLPTNGVVADERKFEAYIYKLNDRLTQCGMHSRIPPNSSDVTSGGPCPRNLAISLGHIAYRFAIPDANELRHYAAGSSTIYGEINLEQMASFVDELNIGPNDHFMDLGSGVGQLVSFVAAYAQTKKSVGVEIMPNLAQMARANEQFSKSLLRHFGKTVNPTRLVHGSFTSPDIVHEIQNEATVICVNNIKFSAELKLELKMILSKCADGTRIISSESIAPRPRSQNSTSSRVDEFVRISTERPLLLVESNTSWTGNTVPFYLTEIKHNQ